MGKVGRAVDGELRLGAAEKLVGARGEAKQDPGRGDDRGPRADGAAEGAGELAVGPAVWFAVVGLDDEVGRRGGAGESEQEACEVVSVENRNPTLGRHQ